MKKKQSRVKIVSSEKENGEHTPVLEDLGIPGHLFAPETRGQGTVNKNDP